MKNLQNLPIIQIRSRRWKQFSLHWGPMIKGGEIWKPKWARSVWDFGVRRQTQFEVRLARSSSANFVNPSSLVWRRSTDSERCLVNSVIRSAIRRRRSFGLQKPITDVRFGYRLVIWFIGRQSSWEFSRQLCALLARTRLSGRSELPTGRTFSRLHSNYTPYSLSGWMDDDAMN